MGRGSTAKRRVDLDPRVLDSNNLNGLVRHGELDNDEKHVKQHTYHKHFGWIEGIEDRNGGGCTGSLQSPTN